MSESFGKSNMIRHLICRLNVWYLDDGTLGGSAEEVIDSLNEVQTSCSQIGLELNPTKCEVVSHDAEFKTAVAGRLAGCRLLAPDEAELLGAPLGKKAADLSLARKIASLHSARSRLTAIDRHDALTLLRLSLGHPKTIYALRSGPAFESVELIRYDTELQETAVECLNVRLDENSWTQASLPPCNGGIGLRTPTSLALPLFLSACSAVSELASRLCENAPDAEHTLALSEWHERAPGAHQPTEVQASKVNAWMTPIVNKSFEALLEHASSRDAARLRAAASAESAAFFESVPSTREGTRLSDNALTCAVGLRLGADVAVASKCSCGAELDSRSDHALSCGRGIGRGARHSEVNKRIRAALASAGVAAILEPVGLDVGAGKRPDGVTVLPFARGREMAWDATICHTCAPSHIPASAANSGAAAAMAEAGKERKYASIRDRVDFRPVGLETLGSFGPGARSLFEDISARIRERTGQASARVRLLRQIGAAIHIGNAACVAEAHSRPAGSLVGTTRAGASSPD